MLVFEDPVRKTEETGKNPLKQSASTNERIQTYSFLVGGPCLPDGKAT